MIQLPQTKEDWIQLLKTSAKDFNADYAEWRKQNPGEKLDLTGIGLFRADLRGADLQGAILNKADLQCADLRGADLRGASLTSAKLISSNLSHANMQGVNLQQVILAETEFGNAGFIRKLYNYPKVYMTDLRGAKNADNPWLTGRQAREAGAIVLGDIPKEGYPDPYTAELPTGYNSLSDDSNDLLEALKLIFPKASIKRVPTTDLTVGGYQLQKNNSKDTNISTVLEVVELSRDEKNRGLKETPTSVWISKKIAEALVEAYAQDPKKIEALLEKKEGAARTA